MKLIVLGFYVGIAVMLVLMLKVRAVPAAGTGMTNGGPMDKVGWSTCLYDQLTKYLHRMAARYSTISRLISIGKSVEGKLDTGFGV